MDVRSELTKRWRHWQYKNTVFLVISILLFFYFARSDFLLGIIRGIGDLGYLGAFITGIFFVSIFTVVPASVVLFDLAEVFSPLTVALLAGTGAVIGDYLIFRFLKNRVFDELAPIFDRLGGSWVKKLFYTPYFIWLLPFAGAFIIASPLPDEIGITLLGLSKVKNWQFIAVSFLLNSAGILAIILLSRTI